MSSLVQGEMKRKVTPQDEYLKAITHRLNVAILLNYILISAAHITVGGECHAWVNIWA